MVVGNTDVFWLHFRYRIHIGHSYLLKESFLSALMAVVSL